MLFRPHVQYLFILTLFIYLGFCSLGHLLRVSLNLHLLSLTFTSCIFTLSSKLTMNWLVPRQCFCLWFQQLGCPCEALLEWRLHDDWHESSHLCMNLPPTNPTDWWVSIVGPKQSRDSSLFVWYWSFWYELIRGLSWASLIQSRCSFCWNVSRNVVILLLINVETWRLELQIFHLCVQSTSVDCCKL